MGSGYKDFEAGNVLAAADVDGYLMRQTVMTFASSAARDTALSAVLDEGMVAYLEDSDLITFYNGSAWLEMTSKSQTWTPTWPGAALTLGNGTLTAFYQRNVDLVTFQVQLIWGSTTSMASLGFEMSLPVTAADATEVIAGITGRAYDLDALTWTYTIMAWPETTDKVLLVSAGASQFAEGNAILKTAPFTWATGDILLVNGTYRAA